MAKSPKKSGGKKKGKGKKEAGAAVEGPKAGDAAAGATTPAAAEDVLYQQSMESRMQGLKLRVDGLRAENAALKQRASKGEKDTHEFVAYFQNEMEKKDQMIAKLSTEIVEKEAAFDKTKAEVAEDCENRIKATQDELLETRTKLEARIKVMEDELAVLTEYKHKRDILSSRIAEAEKRAETLATEHKLELNDLERRYIEKHAKQQRDFESAIEVIKKKAREDAQQGLDTDTRKIIADNKRMVEELRFQLQTSDELQQQNRELDKTCKKFKRNLELAEEKEKEYANRGYFKESELSNAKQKVKSLERTLTQTIREADRARIEVEADHARKIENLQLEVSGLKQLVKLKNKELRNIRGLSQVILDQRTEVEQYFLEALDQVKKEVKLQREEDMRNSAYEYNKQLRKAQASNGGVQFPAIRASTELKPDNPSLIDHRSLGNQLSLQQGVKIELRDLSWEDRERVLRLLFAKINNIENQSTDILKDAAASGHGGLAAALPDQPTSSAMALDAQEGMNHENGPVESDLNVYAAGNATVRRDNIRKRKAANSIAKGGPSNVMRRMISAVKSGRQALAVTKTGQRMGSFEVSSKESTAIDQVRQQKPRELVPRVALDISQLENSSTPKIGANRAARSRQQRKAVAPFQVHRDDLQQKDSRPAAQPRTAPAVLELADLSPRLTAKRITRSRTRALEAQTVAEQQETFDGLLSSWDDRSSQSDGATKKRRYGKRSSKTRAAHLERQSRAFEQATKRQVSFDPFVSVAEYENQDAALRLASASIQTCHLVQSPRSRPVTAEFRRRDDELLSFNQQEERENTGDAEDTSDDDSEPEEASAHHFDVSDQDDLGGHDDDVSAEEEIGDTASETEVMVGAVTDPSTSTPVGLRVTPETNTPASGLSSFLARELDADSESLLATPEIRSI
ncbi:Basal body-orientation factor 1 (Coiled-coil domain-containing protein 176) [Durusdinium trenchii]|uniref:Basal body-orientation factor 1 (Coiled-coil domain-containing protein 176) n=1 Tax=Durusdinium trenchii TaxID=1381693 RepID=A0ABP0JU16_9DINO